MGKRKREKERGCVSKSSLKALNTDEGREDSFGD